MEIHLVQDTVVARLSNTGLNTKLRRRDWVCNLDTISMRLETPADDNEVRILEHRALV